MLTTSTTVTWSQQTSYSMHSIKTNESRYTDSFGETSRTSTTIKFKSSRTYSKGTQTRVSHTENPPVQQQNYNNFRLHQREWKSLQSSQTNETRNHKPQDFTFTLTSDRQTTSTRDKTQAGDLTLSFPNSTVVDSHSKHGTYADLQTMDRTSPVAGLESQHRDRNFHRGRAERRDGIRRSPPYTWRCENHDNEYRIRNKQRQNEKKKDNSYFLQFIFF